MTRASASLKPISEPLQLLRKMRDVMARPEPAQTRLDRLVRVISQEMAADVCSIYLMRAGDVLELFASKGLNPESVHLTRLNVGEGLVGEIAALAAPLNLAEAASHPKFVYKPETGEEIYHSFVGVPIIHSGRVMGVVVVQSKDSISYTDEQVEVLQTVAMVLAEISASGTLVSIEELKTGSGVGLISRSLTGIKLAPGLARAPAVLHRPRLDIHRVLADDPSQEQERFNGALAELQLSMERLIKSAKGRDFDAQREIMETYLLFTQDKGWLKQIGEAIASGLTAEAAVRHVQEHLHMRMAQVSSEYIKERIQDLENLSNRLIQHLTGEQTVEHAKLPEKFILVARSIGPAELLEYGSDKIEGLVLEEGSATSHVAIIARTMDIPVVGRVVDATDLIPPEEIIIVDGEEGQVYVRPSDDIDRQVKEDLAQQKQRSEAFAATRDLPSVTQDGMRVSINLNIGLFADSKQIQEPDVDGIGLFRTELPFMVAPDFPDVDVQAKSYEKILRQADGKRVIFRTFDVGGDKQLPYFPIDDEENPAMGWRATRIALDRPAILRRQCRALIQAAAGCELNIMFPFIAEVAEFEAAHKLLQMEWDDAREEGHTMPKTLRVGTMIEIPSILFQLPSLLPQVDFVSIGSNDLLQFLFAWDRSSQKLTDRYDPMSPIVMNVLHEVASQCEKYKVDVGFCGEMARKPLEAMALLGVGIRNLSMPASSVGPVKTMLRSVNYQHLRSYMDYLRTLSDRSIRSKLIEYAKDHGIDLQ